MILYTQFYPCLLCLPTQLVNQFIMSKKKGLFSWFKKDTEKASSVDTPEVEQQESSVESEQLSHSEFATTSETQQAEAPVEAEPKLESEPEAEVTTNNDTSELIADQEVAIVESAVAEEAEAEAEAEAEKSSEPRVEDKPKSGFFSRLSKVYLKLGKT